MHLFSTDFPDPPYEHLGVAIFASHKAPSVGPSFALHFIEKNRPILHFTEKKKMMGCLSFSGLLLCKLLVECLVFK